MKVFVKLFGLIPIEVDVEVIYTDDMPANTAGYAYGRRKIFIRPEYKDDAGILAHEVGHIQQAWRNPWHGSMYPNLKWYRLKCEVECYKIQLKANPYSWPDYAEKYAGFIANDYGLNVSKEDGLKLLKEES